MPVSLLDCAVRVGERDVENCKGCDSTKHLSKFFSLYKPGLNWLIHVFPRKAHQYLIYDWDSQEFCSK